MTTAVFGSPQADAAVISGVIAAIAGIYAHVRVARANKELENLKDQLGSRRDERNARRDYEYQARKRLYEEIEPLLFQLHEAAEKAFFRCRSLARTAREGHLKAPRSWLGSEGYYLRSTLYHLLLPAVFFRLIQRKMTLVDLDVDNSIRVKYELVKLYFLALTDHYEFAKLKTKLEYKPHEDVTEQKRQASARIYMPQGLVYGLLDQVIDLMITDEPNRTITYGEFEALLSDSARPAALAQLTSTFKGFEPDERPVMARLVLALATIAHLLMEARSNPTSLRYPTTVNALWNNAEKKGLLAWRKRAPQDFEPLRPYFEERLPPIMGRAEDPSG